MPFTIPDRSFHIIGPEWDKEAVISVIEKPADILPETKYYIPMVRYIELCEKLEGAGIEQFDEKIFTAALDEGFFKVK